MFDAGHLDAFHSFARHSLQWQCLLHGPSKLPVLSSLSRQSDQNGTSHGAGASTGRGGGGVRGAEVSTRWWQQQQDTAAA
mmetsp:Transcript_10762/g.27807  ORF Transcript_10762/g.27807 Transcript_10762/m.27807 type:complete len:80 (+) Transcript_10762:781-1020(+)